MGTFMAIVDKEIRAVARERTILLAIVIQLIIASLSSVILFGLMSFYDPATIGQNTAVPVKVGVVGDGDSQLINYLQRSRVTTLLYDSADAAQADFVKGSVDAVIYIPPVAAGVSEMKLFLPQSDSKSTVVLMVLQTPLKKYENYLRGLNGVEVRYQDTRGRSSTTYEFLYSFIVPMLMLFPAFIAGSIMIDTLSEEFENKTLDTLLSTPVSMNTMIGAKLAAAELIAVLQCILWSILLSFNRIYIQNVLLVLVLAAIIAAFVAAGSALIALYFKDRERSQFLYSVLLITVASLSYMFNPSPITLMTRLASGDPGVGVVNVLIYLLPLAILMIALFTGTRKLAALKA
ncbi:MAG: ABC-2 family transporter protein [Methanocella sp. PtaU1.Bin125]|nr:MAG: ABC-2 family transporter protein [Methanocella sp. PtaU1.Bin125]